MISKLKNKKGLIELRCLSGTYYGATEIGTKYVHPDFCCLDEGEEKVRRINIIKQVNCLVPVSFGPLDSCIKEVEGDAMYVVVAHSTGDGTGPFFSAALAVRTFNGIYTDMYSLC